MADFFAGIAEQFVDISHGRRFRLRRAGTGPALVMLHGMPQTHCMWHKIAPALAADHSIICPDLTGYGQTTKPPATPDHAPYAKRAMAQDIIDLLDHLGIADFALIGHDRGARVAHRLALDHPARVRTLTMLDIIPTIEHFERTDMRFAMGYYHWFFLAQPAPFPEELINLDSGRWLMAQSARHNTANDIFAAPALADYHAAIANPATVTAICEDYRAAATIDLDHDRASRANGTRITCPTTILWGKRGLVNNLYDPLAVWRPYCSGTLTGQSIPSGHYLAEEAPEATLHALQTP